LYSGLEWRDGRRKLYGGCTVALSGVMVVESYMEIIRLVKKLN